MESSSTPLADYFWIAGIESVSYDDTPPIQNLNQFKESQPESTIVEDGEPSSDGASATVGRSSSRLTARHSRQGSGSRLSKISFDHRLSMNTLEDLDLGTTASNRSSATIRPVNNSGTANGTAPEGSANGFLGDFDFDKALLKFAAEREDFLDDLTFSAGARVQSRAPMINPRAERIRAEEAEPSGRRSPLRSLRGSIRRRISFRDMNSSRKQPAQARPGTSRTCQSTVRKMSPDMY
jgi:hypothetical protein